MNSEDYWWSQRVADLEHAILLREAQASTRMDKDETINLGSPKGETSYGGHV